MMEMALALIAGITAFALAWYLRGARARAESVPVEARLAALELHHAERIAELFEYDDGVLRRNPPGERRGV